MRRVSAETGLVTILVGDDGAKTMVMAPGANDAFSEADGERLATALQGASDRSVLVVDTELFPHALEPALDAARESGRPTVLDPMRPSRVTDRLLELTNHITPNADEAAELTGLAVESPSDAHRAARRLRQRGPRPRARQAPARWLPDPYGPTARRSTRPRTSTSSIQPAPVTRSPARSRPRSSPVCRLSTPRA